MTTRPTNLLVATGLTCWLAVYGQANPGSAVEAASEVDATVNAGQAVYEQHCVACHGRNGDGNGPAAVWLFPKPRDFSAGLFKIQSTPAGFLPTDEDLFQTVTRGMPGSSMPSFIYLKEQDRRAVTQYIKHLTAYVNESGQRINRFDEATAKNQLGQPIPVPPEPPVTFEALTQGKELFVKLQCVTCHGETGAGDGPTAPTLKDHWGLPLPPRDFNTGSFRGGSRGSDLYLRIATGLAGTPMPPFGEGTITPEERWSLVLYIQSLRRKDVEINDILAPEDAIIRAVKASQQLPLDPTDPAWERLDPTRVPLNPLWPEPDPIPAVAVRAMHDGQQVVLLLQWRDAIANGAPIRVQDFQDAAALQFSLNGATPFLGMGDANNPVNIWQWKAGWQQEADGQRPDVQAIYASMHVDVYFDATPLYRTAESAGNLLASPTRPSPIEDANARGFGTLTTQPAGSQNVRGKGIWRDGHWNVVFARELKSNEADDVKLSPGQPAPVAFAVWDGEHRDRNGKKLVSNWYQLLLEP